MEEWVVVVCVGGGGVGPVLEGVDDVTPRNLCFTAGGFRCGIAILGATAGIETAGAPSTLVVG